MRHKKNQCSCEVPNAAIFGTDGLGYVSCNGCGKEVKIGRYIAFEGIDGCGKSTQAKILAERIGAELVAEPGGSPELTAMIRRHLSAQSTLPQETAALLFAADRTLLYQRVDWFLAHGKDVVSDRSVFSSLAYQTEFHAEEWIRQLNAYAMVPDICIYLQCDVERCLGRCKGDDIYENYEFLQRVQSRYDSLLRDGDEIAYTVDGSDAVDVVSDLVWEIITGRSLGLPRQSEMIQRLTDAVNNDVRWLRRSEPSSATHCFQTDSETSACGLMTMGGVGEWSETAQNEVVWCDLCRRRLSKKCSTAFNSAESRGER